MNKSLRALYIKLKEVCVPLLFKPKSQEVKLNIPFFAQWESTKLVESIINGKISEATKDPKWKNSGAVNKREYLNWSWNMCGMACLKMILSYKKLLTPPLVTLGKMALSEGCYRINNSSKVPGDYLDGLYHYPFLKFVKKKFGLIAQASQTLIVPEIVNQMDRGRLIIASVSPQIRSGKETFNKGGHLVVITGYNLRQKCFWINNPSGFYGQSQKNFKITFNYFSKYFSNRGIIFN